MRQGIDYAWHGKLDPAAWKAKGMSFVCRYLSHDPSKDITPAEARLLSDAGLDIVIVWETTANRAGSGRAAGKSDASEAFAKARLLGMPETAPIYFAVDFDTMGPAVEPYFRGVREVAPLSRIGAYGGLVPVRYLFDQKLIAYGWQTSAWSGGRWDPRVHLQQYRYDFSGGGVGQGDVNRAMFDDFGQWSLRREEEEMAIDLVHDDEAVAAARKTLVDRGIITADPARHPADAAVSNELLWVVAARIFNMIPEGIDLDDYEIQLVKKTG